MTLTIYDRDDLKGVVSNLWLPNKRNVVVVVDVEPDAYQLDRNILAHYTGRNWHVKPQLKLLQRGQRTYLELKGTAELPYF